MLFYYKVDLVETVTGTGTPPILVFELVRGLPDDSMLSAMYMGGREFLGWGTDRNIATATYDAINNNTVASGNWRKQPPSPTPYPRPTKKGTKAEKKEPVSVKSLFGKMSSKYGR